MAGTSLREPSAVLHTLQQLGHQVPRSRRHRRRRFPHLHAQPVAHEPQRTLPSRPCHHGHAQHGPAKDASEVNLACTTRQPGAGITPPAVWGRAPSNVCPQDMAQHPSTCFHPSALFRSGPAEFTPATRKPPQTRHEEAVDLLEGRHQAGCDGTAKGRLRGAGGRGRTHLPGGPSLLRRC